MTIRTTRLFGPLATIMMATLGAPTLFAQTQEFIVAPRGFGARIAALGHAGTSDTRDVSGMYWNPAGLVMLEHPSVVTNTAVLRNGAEAEQMTAVSLTMLPDVVVGLGLVGASHGSEWSRPQVVSYGIGIGAAYRLSPTVSLGILTHLNYASSASASQSAGSMSLGAMYAPTPGLTYGLGYRGLGWGIAYRKRGSGRSPLRIVPVSPRVLELGATFRFPSQYGRPDVTILIASGRLLGQSASVNKAGLEVYPIPQLDVRLGIQKNGSLVYAHWGFGARLSMFQVDYAYMPASNQTVSHEMTIAMTVPALGRVLFDKD